MNEEKNEEKFILPKDRIGYVPPKQWDPPIEIQRQLKKPKRSYRRSIINIDEETDIETIINPENVQEKHLEKVARGYIAGTNRISKRKDIREKLEAKVVEKIGRKGKYLTDKLFELIEGIYIVSSDKNSAVKYYKQPPNLQAIMYALDRALGKPGSAEKDNAENAGTTTIEQIIKKFADGTTETEVKKTTTVKQ